VRTGRAGQCAGRVGSVFFHEKVANMLPERSHLELHDFSAELRSFLGDSRNYPDAAGPVETIETHFALVFLTGHHAYKVKKPILWYDMDFRTSSARRFHCGEEIRLNRELAPDVYLRLDSIGRGDDGHLCWNGGGSDEEFVVVMRRLPAGRMLDELLSLGAVGRKDTTALSRMLCRFHENAEVYPVSGEDYLEHLTQYLSHHHELLGQPVYGQHPALLSDLRERQVRWLADHREEFLLRAYRGLIRECHGDLRPEHICLVEPPCAIDRLEFSRSLRTMDIAEDWALLCLECLKLGYGRFSEELKTARFGADENAAAVWPFYLSKRALAKAKLCAWHLDDPAFADQRAWPDLAESYLELGLAALERG